MQNEFTPLSRHLRIESHLEPLLKETTEKLDKYRKDNEDVVQAIISFDKVLSTKANAWSLVEVKDWVEKEFLNKTNLGPLQKGMDDFKEEFRLELRQAMSKVYSLDNHLAEEVQLCVTADLTKRMKKYEKITKEF